MADQPTDAPPMDSSAAPFTLTRLLAAPRDLVFKAWTDADHLLRWFSSPGMSMFHGEMDLRPGGSFLYGLRSAEGAEMWGKWTFREIVAPERIVLVQHFSNPQGEVTVHPLNPAWPRRTLSTTRFEDRGEQTLLTLEWLPFEASAAEQAVFDAAHDGMRQGWGGTMGQLEAYLAKLVTPSQTRPAP